MSDKIVRVGDASTELALLAPDLEAAREYAQKAKAMSTRRAYASDWTEFTAFCEERGVVALPAAPETLAAFLAHLAKLGRKVATIERKRACVSAAHSAKRLDSPSSAFVVREVMRGIRNTHGSARKKKTALVRDQVRAMIDAAGDGIKGARDRALLAIGLLGAFRRSEIVAIEVEHVRVLGEGLEITIPRSKTDQEGRGRIVGIVRAPAGDEAHCATELYLAWLKVSKINSGHVFRSLKNNHLGGPLPAAAAADVVKACAEAVGVDPDGVAGHSLRRGFITQSVRDGKSEREIMKQTGHKSTKVFREYIEEASVFEGNASEGFWKK